MASGMTRRGCPWAVPLLLGLVTVVVLQAPHASFNIIWRFTVLSFDNPATQLLDDLATDSSTYTDPTAEARESARVAAGGECHLRLVLTAPHVFGPALDSGITRSPPVLS